MGNPSCITTTKIGIRINIFIFTFSPPIESYEKSRNSAKAAGWKNLASYRPEFSLSDTELPENIPQDFVGGNFTGDGAEVVQGGADIDG
jgi:hypothetical protein